MEPNIEKIDAGVQFLAWRTRQIERIPFDVIYTPVFPRQDEHVEQYDYFYPTSLPSVCTGFQAHPGESFEKGLLF